MKPQNEIIFSQPNQQLNLAGGCNAFIPRDFVVRGLWSLWTIMSYANSPVIRGDG
jgi:hypothetical protein